MDSAGEAEVCVGFVHVDFRKFGTKCGSKEWITVHGDGVEDAKLLASIALTESELGLELSSTEGNSTAVQGDQGGDDQIGHGFSGDRIVIGRRSRSDFTVSVTLRSGSFLEKLGNGGGGRNLGSFWLEYHMFGIKICTDRFSRLDNARFAAIRDSFKVRSCWEDLSAFLRGAPIAVVVNGVGVDRGFGKGERVCTLGVATVGFDALFDGVEKEGWKEKAMVSCAVPVVSGDGGGSDGKVNQDRDSRGRRSGNPVVSVELSVEKERDGKEEEIKMVDVPRGGIVVEEEGVGEGEVGVGVDVDEGGEEVEVAVKEDEGSPPFEEGVDAEEQTGNRGNEIQEALATEEETGEVSEAQEREEERGVALASTDSGPSAGKHSVKLCVKFVDFVDAERCDVFIDVQGERRPAKQKEDPMRFVIEVDPSQAFVLVCVNSDDPSEVFCEITTGEFEEQLKKGDVHVDMINLNGGGPSLGSIVFHVEKAAEVKGRFTARVRIMAIESLELTERDVFVRYTYPLFDIDPEHPVRTKPAVRVNRMDYRKLPHGDHEFEFAAAASQISTIAKNTPLVFQVCDADGTVLGEAQLLLKQVGGS